MPILIGISGNPRAGSYNSAWSSHAQSVAPKDATLQTASIAETPPHNGETEKTKGLPLAVAEFKERIAVADGILLAAPEYNNSIAGVLKNTIERLTRPASDIPRVFGGRPIAITSATPGGWGTAYSQAVWLPVPGKFGIRPWFGRTPYVSRLAAGFSGLEGDPVALE